MWREAIMSHGSLIMSERLWALSRDGVRAVAFLPTRIFINMLDLPVDQHNKLKYRRHYARRRGTPLRLLEAGAPLRRARAGVL